MVTQPTGSDKKGDTEIELLSITSKGYLSLVISGKPSHPYSDLLQAEETIPVRVIFAGKNSYDLQIFNGSVTEIHEGFGKGGSFQFAKKNIPLFYEQRAYQFTLAFVKEDPEDTIELWHENKLIRNAIKDVEKLKRDQQCTLVGSINFGNEIGYTEFEVRVNGKTEIFLTLEILPSKRSRSYLTKERETLIF